MEVRPYLRFNASCVLPLSKIAPSSDNSTIMVCIFPICLANSERLSTDGVPGASIDGLLGNSQRGLCSFNQPGAHGRNRLAEFVCPISGELE